MVLLPAPAFGGAPQTIAPALFEPELGEAALGGFVGEGPAIQADMIAPPIPGVVSDFEPLPGAAGFAGVLAASFPVLPLLPLPP